MFAAAPLRALTDAEIETYIDRSVTGADRVLAHRLMASMPPNRRGDFIYLSKSGHLVSNNPAWAAGAKITRGTLASSAGAKSFRRASDYSDACSPPNPPSKAGGPYVRLVSTCGFAAGWGFVSVPAGTSSFGAGEAGHLYFEIQAPHQGTTTEGGFEYYSDASIAPYGRSTAAEYSGVNNGYLQLTNGTARYLAGNKLAIFHGLTDSGLKVFTNSGELPAGLDPATEWITSEQVALVNPGWLFFDAAGDMNGAGTDPLGNFSPCTGCSVSKVTSIAQNGTISWNASGAYFGVDSNGDNSIEWNQVAFGNWANDCEPGTSLCTFMTSNNPYSYYGGPQYYPDSSVSQADMAATTYGPYESYDGIDTWSDIYPSKAVRRPLGGFTEPLPPPATPTPVPTPRPTPSPKCGPCPCPQSSTLHWVVSPSTVCAMAVDAKTR
jgi:hypothetical protein